MRPPLLSSVAVFGLAAAGLAAMLALPQNPAEQTSLTQVALPGTFERAEASTIQESVQEILSDPRFAPRTTLFQWLRGKLWDWELPRLNLSDGWVRVILWAITAWCVITILAILGHIAWTVAILVRSRRAAGRMRTGRERLRSGTVATYDSLHGQMERLAARGAFRQALGMMMVALLRWLDEAGILRFHQSKTNGDYVSEYLPARPGSGLFRHFALAFDGIIYGGAPCGPEEYAHMHAVFQQVQDRVAEKP